MCGFVLYEQFWKQLYLNRLNLYQYHYGLPVGCVCQHLFTACALFPAFIYSLIGEHGFPLHLKSCISVECTPYMPFCPGKSRPVVCRLQCVAWVYLIPLEQHNLNRTDLNPARGEVQEQMYPSRCN